MVTPSMTFYNAKFLGLHQLFTERKTEKERAHSRFFSLQGVVSNSFGSILSHLCKIPKPMKETDFELEPMPFKFLLILEVIYIQHITLERMKSFSTVFRNSFPSVLARIPSINSSWWIHPNMFLLCNYKNVQIF